jgi:hypothetical protein
MSKASKYKVRALVHHREQAARYIVSSQPVTVEREDAGSWRGSCCGVSAFHTSELAVTTAARAGAVKHLLAGRTAFDVSAARALGQRLIAKADDLVEVGRILSMLGPPGQAETMRILMAAATARVGQRLLDAIAGQPSECWGCIGGEVAIGATEIVRGQRVTVIRSTKACSDCHGTGHNLRGVLPPIVWSPAVRRKLADEMTARQTADLPTDDTWGTIIHEAISRVEPGWRFGLRTRTVPRGEHRSHIQVGRIQARQHDVEFHIAHVTADHDAHVRAWLFERLPRWRRRELRHAEERRARS